MTTVLFVIYKNITPKIERTGSSKLLIQKDYY